MHMIGTVLCRALVVVLLTLPSLSYAQTEFDSATFNELATRAEQVVDSGQASSDALEELRTALSDARSAALEAQSLRKERAETLREQIAALGKAPEDGQLESAEIATRRQALNAQLALANAPLIAAQEAYQRANGLISEIDTTIRSRQTTTLFERGSSPLNPLNWIASGTAVATYLGQVEDEIAVSVASPTSSALRSNNMLSVVLLCVLGLFLLIPASRWVGRKMDASAELPRSTSNNVFRLALSFLVFLVPYIGFLSLIGAFGQLDYFGLRGSYILAALPAVGLAVFGSNWLGRNLFVKRAPAAALVGLKQERLHGAYTLTRLLGVVLALGLFLRVIYQGADFAPETRAVLQFPLILIGAYGLIMLGGKVRGYRSQLKENETVNPITDRITWILYYGCLAAGIIGPVSAAFGYANVANGVVFSTIFTLAVVAGFFILYTLIAVFVQDASTEQEQETDDQPVRGGLFRVLLAVALACVALPILALIWGARVSDLQDLWLALREGVKLGETRISFSDFLTFVVIFSVGYTLTRLLQSTLRSSVLPNTRIDSGAQNAMVTGLGYVGIFLAALLAIMSTGLDLSNLAIVAGALSVGIGFGLQNIVSNFVSGIILLIERPIKIGDWIEVGTTSGYVSDISVRATTIETFDQSDVVVPNADLISGSVTNMTLRNNRGRIKVPVGVAYDSDPERVKEILLDIISAHPMVLKRPEPSVFLLGFGADSIDFEVRGILRDVNYGLSTRSAINFEILKRFNEEGIEIPFGQREIRIKNPAEIGKALSKK